MRRRRVHYNGHRDVLAIDGLVLPGESIDHLREAATGTALRVRISGDSATRLEVIGPAQAPELAHEARALADSIEHEGGDRLAGRLLQECAAELDLLREVVADLARQLEGARV